MLPWTKELKIFEGIEQQNLFTLVNLIQVQIHDKAETFHPLCDRKKEKRVDVCFREICSTFCSLLSTMELFSCFWHIERNFF